MTRGVGIDLVSFGRGQIVGRLQHARAERDCLGVGFRRIVDVQIEMDLLLDSIGWRLGTRLASYTCDGQQRCGA